MSNVEERLTKLEEEVEALKRDRSDPRDLAAKKPGWISRITGTFANDPEFDEILRLGREERQADKPSQE